RSRKWSRTYCYSTQQVDRGSARAALQISTRPLILSPPCPALPSHRLVRFQLRDRLLQPLKALLRHFASAVPQHPQLLASLQMLEPRVGHGRVAEVQPTEVLEPRDMHQARVGDRGSAEEQILQVRELLHQRQI